MRTVPSVQTLVVVVLAIALTGGISDGQICGDVNGDGMVTDTDGVLVLQEAAQLPAELSCAPVSSGCDHNAHRIKLDGESLRKTRAPLTTDDKTSK